MILPDQLESFFATPARNTPEKVGDDVKTSNDRGPARRLHCNPTVGDLLVVHFGR